VTFPVTDFDVGAFLGEERCHVDAALERALQRITPALSPGLAGAVEQGVIAGGKRLRPILCVTAWRACVSERGSGDAATPEAVYDLSISLELIHAYSLMHDDLPCMDDAPLRRGRPTPHVVHGEMAAVLGGAALIPVAALELWRAGDRLGLEEPLRRRLLVELTRAAGPQGMVGGQALDLLGEGERLSRDELDDLHRRKTGALLTASLVLGGLAARASERRLEALERYGREIGLAFQIADDVLDATSDSGTLGKAPSDRELGKSTYVSLLGVDAAREEARARVVAGVAELASAELATPPLIALADYVVSRER